MKYSPKYKIKAIKEDLSHKTNEVLLLKQQITTLSDQNHNLRRKLQLSSSNLSLMNEEIMLKSTLSNEELNSLSQNNQFLQTYLAEMQQKMFLLSQDYQRLKAERDNFQQENTRLFYENSSNLKEKSILESKFLKKKEAVSLLLKENEEIKKQNQNLTQEISELKTKLKTLSEENRNYEDKIYRLHETSQKKDEGSQKEHKNLEKSFTDLQKNYEKLYEEFSSLDRLRQGYLEQRAQDEQEIHYLKGELQRNTNENTEIKEKNSNLFAENSALKHDVKALVLSITSGQNSLLHMVDLKSDSQELLLLKSLIYDFLKERHSTAKKEKKMIKTQSNLLSDMRFLQEKFTDLTTNNNASHLSPTKSIMVTPNPPPPTLLSKSYFEEPQKDAYSKLRSEVSPYKPGGSFISETKSFKPLNAFPTNTNPVPAKSNDMIMIIGSLLQILAVINTKFQRKYHYKDITSFSLDYFIRIHGIIKQTSEELFAHSQLKTPRKSEKHVVFRQRTLRKLRKIGYVVIFAQILLKNLRKKKGFEEDPAFFQAKFMGFPQGHVLHLAKNHFLLNNFFLNEVSLAFNKSHSNFQDLLNELLAIDCPFSLMQRRHSRLQVDTSVIDIDNCNFLRIIRELQGNIGKGKVLVNDKMHKEMENRIKSLNSEKKALKQKLENRSKKLDDAEKKVKAKERKVTMSGSKNESFNYI